MPLRFPERIERAKMIQKHELPILEYDSNSEEVIRPNHGAEQLKLPEKCVYAFLGEAVDDYARTLLPLAYDDFFAAAKSAMKPRHRAMLHKLLDFRFDRRATRYNLPPKRLKIIEKEIQRRARVLLG